MNNANAPRVPLKLMTLFARCNVSGCQPAIEKYFLQLQRSPAPHGKGAPAVEHVNLPLGKAAVTDLLSGEGVLRVICHLVGEGSSPSCRCAGAGTCSSREESALSTNGTGGKAPSLVAHTVDVSTKRKNWQEVYTLVEKYYGIGVSQEQKELIFCGDVQSALELVQQLVYLSPTLPGEHKKKAKMVEEDVVETIRKRIEEKAVSVSKERKPLVIGTAQQSSTITSSNEKEKRELSPASELQHKKGGPPRRRLPPVPAKQQSSTTENKSMDLAHKEPRGGERKVKKGPSNQKDGNGEDEEKEEEESEKAIQTMMMWSAMQQQFLMQCIQQNGLMLQLLQQSEEANNNNNFGDASRHPDEEGSAPSVASTSTPPPNRQRAYTQQQQQQQRSYKSGAESRPVNSYNTKSASHTTSTSSCTTPSQVQNYPNRQSDRRNAVDDESSARAFEKQLQHVTFKTRRNSPTAQHISPATRSQYSSDEGSLQRTGHSLNSVVTAHEIALRLRLRNKEDAQVTASPVKPIRLTRKDFYKGKVSPGRQWNVGLSTAVVIVQRFLLAYRDVSRSYWLLVARHRSATLIQSFFRFTKMLKYFRKTRIQIPELDGEAAMIRNGTKVMVISPSECVRCVPILLALRERLNADPLLPNHKIRAYAKLCCDRICKQKVLDLAPIRRKLPRDVAYTPILQRHLRYCLSVREKYRKIAVPIQQCLRVLYSANVKICRQDSIVNNFDGLKKEVRYRRFENFAYLRWRWVTVVRKRSASLIQNYVPLHQTPYCKRCYYLSEMFKRRCSGKRYVSQRLTAHYQRWMCMNCSMLLERERLKSEGMLELKGRCERSQRNSFYKHALLRWESWGRYREERKEARRRSKERKERAEELCKRNQLKWLKVLVDGWESWVGEHQERQRHRTWEDE